MACTGTAGIAFPIQTRMFNLKYNQSCLPNIWMFGAEMTVIYQWIYQGHISNSSASWALPRIRWVPCSLVVGFDLRLLACCAIIWESSLASIFLSKPFRRKKAIIVFEVEMVDHIGISRVPSSVEVLRVFLRDRIWIFLSRGHFIRLSFKKEWFVDWLKNSRRLWVEHGTLIT